MNNESHYNKKNKPLARKLRKDSTQGEIILWDEVLKGKQFYGYQFNRQFPIDDYIADFICRELRLIVEIDGYSHRFRVNHDRDRDQRLKELGYTTIRFSEKEVIEDLRNVVRALKNYLKKYSEVKE